MIAFSTNIGNIFNFLKQIYIITIHKLFMTFFYQYLLLVYYIMIQQCDVMQDLSLIIKNCKISCLNRSHVV
jgi:hypothetical protein